ncbi:MAG TPA: phosphoribosylformylglycinamidine synthase subunit PurL [Methanosarcinales archaeon]|nr:phosphoribosylformylglycinamidine synthase subunit PurL [Methanosarcinales archaeon]
MSLLPPTDLETITKRLNRPPNPVEEGCFLNLWSEHCSYRSSAKHLRTFPTESDRVIIGPGDDAAIVRLKGDLVLAIGMESHNHPSYVDPYNGAATGVGGIVRDILSMGTRPIALMDLLYFGMPDQPKNLYLFEHVVEGIAGYGNCIGVPVVRGETFFHDAYSGNPLVNVVCVGLAHEENIVTATAQRAGDALILMGSTTGRDGLGGASFASRDLSEDSEAEDRSSVQIGDPFTEKLVIDAVLEAIESGYVLACRDLGAAGLVGASAEMGAKGNLGLHIDLDRVPLRESEMTPYEILIAESQERMVLEVDPSDTESVLAIAEKYDLNCSVIGEFTDDGQYLVEFEGGVVVDLPINFLSGGAPARKSEHEIQEVGVAEEKIPEIRDDLATSVLKLMASPNIAPKEWVYRQYDHEVQIRTVVKPGDDSGVLRIEGASGIFGIALSCGCNPAHITLDPYNGAAGSVLENAMNLACKGARPIAIVNCLNFGDPEDSTIYRQFAESVRGIGDMAQTLSVPVVGGNVSFYNESDEFGTAIPPTPSIGMVGIVEERGTQTQTSSHAHTHTHQIPGTRFADAGDTIILVGATADELGGSEYHSIYGCSGGRVPAPPADPQRLIDTVIGAIDTGCVTSAHDISNGGIAVALSEMAREGNIGATIDLTGIGDGDLPHHATLFSESHGRVILATPAPDAVLGRLRDIPHRTIGTVGGDELIIGIGGDRVVALPLRRIRDAGEEITRMMR